MKEGILVIIREMGLFARLSRREKKKQKKEPRFRAQKNSVHEEQGVSDWCREVVVQREEGALHLSLGS